MLSEALRPALESGMCPHLAVLVRAAEDLPPVLASFYALGAKRGGWLVHRSLPGEVEADRHALTAAGLDVPALERERRLTLVELDPELPPEDYGRSWEQPFQDALTRGFSAMWYSRFAVGGEVADLETVLAHDREWDAWFRGRAVVTLCPFIVGDLDAAAVPAGIAELHDGVIAEPQKT
jgi:MEDS: MEthanogen/methylotroph, DcmR Sensory domain